MVTKLEKEHSRKVADLGCSLCRHQGNAGTPAELHHIRRAGRRSDAPETEEANLIVEIDLQRSESVRRWWPFLRDRRIDAYSDLTKRFIDNED